MIDWKRVIELREEVGADEFDAVLELFLDEVEGVVMRLSNSDAGQLERDLHFLKGSAWNLGFTDFANLCEGSEHQAAHGNVDMVCVDALVSSYSGSKQIFMRDLAHVVGPDQHKDADVA